MNLVPFKRKKIKAVVELVKNAQGWAIGIIVKPISEHINEVLTRLKKEYE